MPTFFEYGWTRILFLHVDYCIICGADHVARAKGDARLPDKVTSQNQMQAKIRCKPKSDSNGEDE